MHQAHLTARNWSKARRSLEYALDQARQHQLGLEAEASFLAFLAEAMAGCGEPAQALDTAEEAVAVACRKETLFWELQAQIALAGALLRARKLEEQTRISEALARADDLIEITGGAVMKPFVSQSRADWARLRGEDTKRQQLFQQAHRQFTSMGAHGHAERLASELKEIEAHSVD